jgi:hypothetical protein
VIRSLITISDFVFTIGKQYVSCVMGNETAFRTKKGHLSVT